MNFFKYNIIFIRRLIIVILLAILIIMLLLLRATNDIVYINDIWQNYCYNVAYIIS